MSRIFSLILTLLLMSCATGDSESSGSFKVALVDAVSGVPYVLRETRLIQLSVRSAIDVEDTVITGPEDQVQFEFEDGTLVTAGHNTQLRVDSFRPKEGIHLSASDGTFTIRLGKSVNPENEGFRLSTPYGELKTGERTRLWLNHTDSDELEVVLLEKGELLVSNEFGSTRLDNAGHGVSLSFSAAPSEARIWSDIQSLVALEFTPLKSS